MRDPQRTRTWLTAVVLLAAAVVLPGCQKTYYATMEKLGYLKRDLLVSEVEEARDEQQQAKQQFQSALDQFMAVAQGEGGELEAKYRKLQRELDRCEADATAVRERIESIEGVADALFTEWEKELDQYNSAELRRSSERQLAQTKQRYGVLVGAMRKAEAGMEPVLVVFRDHVLYLKHNLNARAIASLRGAVVSLESDVSGLIAQMQASIDEANAFIDSMVEGEDQAEGGG